MRLVLPLSLLVPLVAIVAADDLATVFQRRLPFVVQSIPNSTALADSIPAGLAALNADGSYTDVDYTSGCPAQRANWPAQGHWMHIVAQAAVWTGAFPDARLAPYVNNATLLADTLRSMDWWFTRDFTLRACLDEGGTDLCPCGTPGLWNTNWFSNVILIPKLVGQACLLLRAQLSDSQVTSCANITARSFSTFAEVPKQGFLSGANVLDIASIGITSGILSNDTSIVAQAFGFIGAEIIVHPQIKVDGIKPDGGFQQHSGLLYNGNYGKDYTNDGLELFTESAGTQWQTSDAAQAAFASLLDGTSWMVYQNTKTSVLHYDFSSLGRFISFAVADLGQTVAVSSILINVTQIQQLGNLLNDSTIKTVAARFQHPTGTANVGALNGNRMFFSNDFMVHRAKTHVTTVKMFSTRTLNTECVNLANPLGFHLSDGTVYTHLDGTEYEDIAAAWDWNLIAGTTVDYGGTPLNCATALQTGKEAFVGGVSDGVSGLAVMRYTNPITGALKWQKAWALLEGGAQHVMVNSIQSTTGLDVYSVLDQRRLSGQILLDGKPLHASRNATSFRTLLHGGVGYVFPQNKGAELAVSFGARTGAWTALGTSTQPPETVDLFAAWLHHKNLSQPLSYTAHPGLRTQQALSAAPVPVELANTGDVSAVLDPAAGKLFAVLWSTNSTVNLPIVGGLVSLKISADVPLALIVHANTLNAKKWTLTAADPSQSLSAAKVTLSVGADLGKLLGGWTGVSKSVSVAFPTGGLAGKSVTVPVL